MKGTFGEEFWKAVAWGMFTNVEIAEMTGVSEGTVGWWRYQLSFKYRRVLSARRVRIKRQLPLCAGRRVQRPWEDMEDYNGRA